MSFFNPPKPPRPPAPPTRADASVQLAAQNANLGYQSLINTSPTGLQRPPQQNKRSLIGGA